MKNLGLLLGIVNTVAIAAVLGIFVYTKVIYKHPVITETKERAKLILNQHQPDTSALKKAIVTLDPITANLDPFKDVDGKEKSHFVSMTLAIELRSEADVEKFQSAKPVILDKILQSLAKKRFEDLDQVQGRYVFHSQIIDSANTFMGAPIVTEIYFSDFLLQ